MKTKLKRRALLLSYFTVLYNIAEGILSILAGLWAGSVSLVGFGLDSAVESISAMIMVWRFKKDDMDPDEEETVEERALNYVGYTFFVLGFYVLYESVSKLYRAEIPEPSLLGIIIALASIIVMPFLFYLKYRTGKDLKSKSLIADSKETLSCFFLSIALLTGLLLNYFWGIWQADPIIGLLISVYLLREGYEILFDKDD
ncbi:MAG: cation transporter [Methanobacteriaceae archaeon]|nr:cation transporter [Methanobacteriaceae archaeon]